MIFERRAYTLRPGKVDAFWDAQLAWNTPDVFGDILDRNIAYFSTITGDADQVVHLYRFDSLDDWRARYEAYYRKQSPDYFALVRPWMLRQENGFFAAAPIPELAAFEAPLEADAANAVIVEQVTNLCPGGLVPYWNAYREHALAAGEVASRGLLGAMVSLVGRLHRVTHYRCFASLADAQDHAEALRADARWRDFLGRWRDVAAGGRSSLLRLSPLPSRRPFFERRG